MAVGPKKSIKILFRFDFPAGTVRVWAGSGPYIDADGNAWRGGGALTQRAISEIEYAFAGELYTFDAWMAGTDPEFYNIAYQESQGDDVVGAKVQVLIQNCDEYDQPDGTPPVVKFTGKVIDVQFLETMQGDKEGRLYQVGVKISNRNNLRRMTSGSVLSDADQKARSLVLNAFAALDKFCERVVLMADKTINWPRF